MDSYALKEPARTKKSRTYFEASNTATVLVVVDEVRDMAMLNQTQ